jgi:hypothetical protein
LNIFYDHAPRPPSSPIKKICIWNFLSGGSNGLFKPLLDPGGRFASETAARISQACLVNLQAGAPECHPSACKFITLGSLSIFHNPVYKKTGSIFYGGAIWPKIGHFFDQKGLTWPRITQNGRKGEIKARGINNP